MKRFMLCLLAIVLGMGLLRHVRQGAPMCATIVVAEETIREPAEGLPVPIYPGTRVTEAELSPPRAARPRRGTELHVPDGASVHIPTTRRSDLPATPTPTPTARTIAGRLSATTERARDDARTQLEREAADWLAPEIPPSWKIPPHLLNSLIVETHVKPIVKEYGTVYEATQRVEFSTAHRDEIRAAYQGDLIRHRLITLGGALGFVLACLAALSAYIRADEATKGYYTPWLRTIAAGGVGAAGVVIYELLA